MPRFQLDGGAEFRHRIGNATDPRVDRPERIPRVGVLRHLRRDDLKVSRRGPEIAGLVQRDPQLVVRRHLLRLERHRLGQRRDREGVLSLTDARDAELQLCEWNLRFRGRHSRQQRKRSRKCTRVDEELRAVQIVGDADAVFGIDTGVRRCARSADVTERREPTGELRIDSCSLCSTRPGSGPLDLVMNSRSSADMPSTSRARVAARFRVSPGSATTS